MDDQRADREGGGMRFRKLRIAWSVMCGIICVLLIALWMRSYRWHEGRNWLWSNTGYIHVSSDAGLLYLGISEVNPSFVKAAYFRDEAGLYLEPNERWRT